MQRYFAIKKQDNMLYLDPTDLYHIKTVMRMKIGDMIEAVYEHTLFLCTVLSLTEPVVEIKEQSLETELVRSKLTIVIPYLKEQKIDYILQKTTELGVDEIIFLSMEHSMIKLDVQKKAKKKDRWKRICKEASEQAKRLSLPTIETAKTIADIDKIPGLKLVCSTKKDRSMLKSVLQKQTDYDRILVVIGPEGGLSEAEETEFINRGFIPVSLGNTILRAETAPVALLAMLQYEWME